MLDNHSSVRLNNTHHVLTQIINNPEISRAEISKKTGLNKASVSEIVRKLIEDNYVIETGVGESSDSGGRRPILLKLNKTAGISVSFDIRHDKISYMMNYLNGELILIDSIEISINKSNVINIIENIITDYKKKMPAAPYGIIGISIAIHGIISNNKIHFTPYYDLNQLNLANTLEKKLNIPIFLENEANLAALAEASYNSSHKILISCSIHTGVGAGIIIDGKLYRGFQGNSGEVGHTTLYPDGVQCPCGNAGCLEQYCSQSSLLKAYQDTLDDNTLTIDNLILDYKNKDAPAIEIIEQFARNLSIGIFNLIGFYGPEIIYINSELFKKIPTIINMIQDSIYKNINRNIQIKNSQIPDNASLRGATVYNIQKFLGVESLHLKQM